MSNITPILKLVARTRRRIILGAFLRAIAKFMLWAGAALLVVSVGAKVAARWWPAMGERGMWFVLLAAVVLVGLAVWAYFARPRSDGDVAVASLIDVRLKLHDRLSTAVAVADRTDPFAQAAVEDGLKIANDRRLIESLDRSLPIETPRSAWAGPVLVAIACAVWWFVPGLAVGNAQAMDETNSAELSAARDAAKVEIETLQAKIQANPELNKALAQPGNESKLAANLADEKLQSPEEVRRETTRKVNDLSKRLDDLLSGEKAQQLEVMKDALSRLEPSKSGALMKLSEALKRGDPAAAKSAIAELQKQINDGQMDEKTRQELAKKLNDLAEQLKDAAKANDSLKKALENAGLDGDLAKNPDAAKSAIDAAKNLTESQKKALKQALAAQSQAGKKIEKLAQACQSMSNQCNNPGKSGKSGAGTASSGEQSSDEQGAESASQMLSDMEALNEMMKDAEAARSQCNNGGTGASDKESGSSGMNVSRGRGTGGERTQEKTATDRKVRKERVASTGGEVIARQLVEAPPVVGESRATLEQLSGEIGRGYEEGTEEDPVPANLRDLHKHYFGDLKKKIDAKSGQPAAPQPATVPVGVAPEPAPAVPAAPK